MHPALSLEEILRGIFSHCDRAETRKWGPGGPRGDADLVSLARTCRAFKEPALDLLWMNLSDLSRLVRCLPRARRLILRGGKRIYALERDLEPTEMDTVRAYACRVRVLDILSWRHFDPDTLGHLCRTSRNEPLFTNLRLLNLLVVNHVIPLLHHVAAPNLRDLTLVISTSASSSYEGFIRSLSSSSLALQNMSIRFLGGWSSAAFSDIMNQHICHWTHLRSMNCPDMSMDIDTFFHLSRTSSLTQLSFTLNAPLIAQIETSNHVFAFPALESIMMTLNTTSMVPDFKFFTYLRLPKVDSICTYYDTFPSKDMVRSFAMALQTTCSHELVRMITLNGSSSWSPLGAEPTTLVLDDILPFAAFNLTQMRIELDWIVDLKDTDLLRLASDCPRIESLILNEKIGWRSAGITPVGLMKVLRLCPLLWEISVALDTRGSQLLLHHQLESESLIGSGLGDPLPSMRSIFFHFSDSTIEAESVPALAAFFVEFIPSHAWFMISSWESDRVQRLQDNWEVYQMRWRDVQSMAKDIITERSKRLCNSH